MIRGLLSVIVLIGLAAGLARAQEGGDDTIGLLIGVLKETEDPAAQADMLKGLNAAMEGKKGVKMPAGWPELYAKLAKSANESVKAEAQKLAAVFGDASTLEAMKKLALDASKDKAERVKALDSLIAKGDPSLVPTLQALVKDPALRESAIKGLAGFDDPKTPAGLVEAYPSFDTAAKLAAANTLASRKTYAKELMKAAQAGKIPVKELTAATVRTLREFKDKEIDDWIASVWGVARSTPEDKLKQIEDYKAMLTSEALKSGNPSVGRALFAKTCQQCHTLYDEGGKVGPDLTGSNRQDLDYILQNIVDPSSVIAKDYQVTNIWTKDDQILSGIVTREDDSVITIMTESDTVTIERKQIDDLRKSELSMMPEGLLTAMSKEEVIHLVSYLRTQSQVPMAELKK
jgi:putative heme-binding domain-containing protein